MIARVFHLLACYCSIGTLLADSPPEEAFAILEATDITVANDAPVRLQIWYHSPVGINPESGDNHDLWIASANGFHSETRFLEWLPLRRLGATAAYELAAPEGGWTREHNGEYAVMLASDEIETNDGGSFPLTLTGSFRVSIGDNKRTVTPLAGTVSVETFPTPGVPGGEHQELAVATFSATFPYPVEVNWSGLTVSEIGQFSLSVDACDFFGIVPQVVTTYTHRVELGMLGTGTYSASLRSGAAVLDTTRFEVGNPGNLVKGLPSDVAIEIRELPTLGILPAYSANVRLTFDQFVAESAWGELQRDDTNLTSEFTAWIDPTVSIFAPVVIEHEVFLGMLEPGQYLYQLSSLEQIIGRKEFVAGTIGGGDLEPPSVIVRGAKVAEPGEAPLEFTVSFNDPSGLDIAGIEAQTLTAMNWRGEVFPVERIALAVTEDLPPSGAFATYQIEAPGGTWGTEDRGRYRLLLSEPELIADLDGNHLTSPRIGYLTVDIQEDDPQPINPAELTLINHELTGRWTAKARLFVPEDLAVRDDWSIDWGGARPPGPSFYLFPRFVEAGSGNPIGPIPPSDTGGAGMWVEHDYDLGPISHGSWPVYLESNLGHFAKEILEAGTPDDGIEPFDLWKDGIAPTGDLWEYTVGTDPNNPGDDHLGDPQPELISGADGKRHLGLRCRIASTALDARLRFQGSTDMNTWIDLGPDQIEEVERNHLEGGIEELVVCLSGNLEQSNIRYLRVIAERW
ncbi:hypothetical protein N9A94_06890 [Akkermansiaceae bacterium]|nr:hypothetical protein [Akkermansiaceae bacterium]MDA7888416.1 hypothetical protein [Akkermansiaceae bacterium]MDB4544648.1 hypothetical protein [Akkermansiaceae bacterium]